MIRRVVRRAWGEWQDVRGKTAPWTSTYERRRRRYLSQALDDASLLSTFRGGGELPPGYGVGLDERCIEYPWVFATLSERPGLLLDAGSSLNHDYLLVRPEIARHKVHILTLAPEPESYWRMGISYLYSDLREIPLRDGFFDQICCISTLEHIGFDNAMYSNGMVRQRQPLDFLLSVRELARVLKPGGTLLLTVPFGSHEELGTFQQFDSELLNRAVDAFEPSQVRKNFFRYLPDGWRRATEEECSAARYVQWIAGVWSERKPIPLRVPVEPDGAAAARAVACVQLFKPEHPLG